MSPLSSWLDRRVPCARRLCSYPNGKAEGLPWEVLGCVYSFCDKSTLAVLSLVSFGSWEMAGPILYEHVELRSLDGVKSFFFLTSLPPSARLEQAVPLLSRIKTLRLDFNMIHQRNEPMIKILPESPGYPPQAPTYEPSLLPPSRLLRPGSIYPLPLDKLILPIGIAYQTTLDYTCSQLLPHLNPRTVVHCRRRDARQHRGAWPVVRLQDNPNLDFLSACTKLERIVWAGPFPVWLERDHQTPYGGEWRALCFAWSPPDAIPARPLQLEFHFAPHLDSYVGFAGDKPQFWREHQRRFSYQPGPLVELLEHGGVSQRLAGLVDVKVKLVVDGDDLTEAESDIAGLPAWMKKLVVVETVG